MSRQPLDPPTKLHVDVSARPRTLERVGILGTLPRCRHRRCGQQEICVVEELGHAFTRRGAAGVSFAAMYVGCMTMTEADVLEVLLWLGEGEVAVWLKGGWGVDALVGEQTRDHEDLDLIVRDDDVSRMSDVLYPHGFLLSRGAQGGFNLRDERDRLVDVHPVRFDDRGNGHFEQDRGSFEHPAGAFAAAGTIAGRRLACLSAEAQMTDHAWGYTPGESDFHDMRLLNSRLGTALLPPYIP